MEFDGSGGRFDLSEHHTRKRGPGFQAGRQKRVDLPRRSALRGSDPRGRQIRAIQANADIGRSGLLREPRSPRRDGSSFAHANPARFERLAIGDPSQGEVLAETRRPGKSLVARKVNWDLKKRARGAVPDAKRNVAPAWFKAGRNQKRSLPALAGRCDVDGT